MDDFRPEFKRGTRLGDATAVLQKSNGKNLILSLGGGASPGMSKANVEALVAAAKAFRK